MTTRTTKSQLLAGTSALALIAAASIIPTQAYAAWSAPAVSTSSAVQNTDTGGSGDTLAIADGGSLTFSTGGNTVATNTGTTGVITISEGSTNYALGIINSSVVNAADAAIGTTTSASPGVAAAGTITSITIGGTATTGGTISSKSTFATSGTINLVSTAVQATTINNNLNGTITNAGLTGGNAIYFDNGTGPGTLTINNASGTISAPTAGQTVIKVGATGAHIVNINNTLAGAITSASATDKAIAIANGGGVATLVNSGTATILGTVGLGNNAGSTFTVSGGTVTGAVTMGHANQVLTLSGGQIVGQINGAGKVVAAANYVSNGNLAALTKLTVNDGFSFDASTNNNTIAATGVTIGSAATTDATLKLGTGAVTGTIDGDAAGHGVVNFTANNTTNGVIGGSFALKTISITGTATTVDASANNNAITATNVVIGSGNTLKLGTGAVTGAIDGASAGVGIVNFAGNQTTAGDIGKGTVTTNGLAAVNITGTTAITAASNIVATTTTIGDATNTASLTLNSAKTITGNVVIANAGTLTQTIGGTPSSITGTINGGAAGKGTYALTSAGTFTQANTIGATNSLLAFTTADGVVSNLSKTITATTTAFGGGTSGSEAQSAGTITTTGGTTIAAGNTFTQTGGSIAGAVNLGTTGILAISGGSGFTSTIDGAGGAGRGTLNLASAFTTAGAIGATNSLLAVNVNSGATLSLGEVAADVLKATTTTVNTGGTLKFGGTAHSSAGDIVGAGTGTINLGTQTQTIAAGSGSGNFTTAAGGQTVAIGIRDTTTNHNGNLSIAGAAVVDSSTKLYVDSSAVTGYIASGTAYKWLTSTGNNNSAVLAAANVTDSSPLLTWAESVVAGAGGTRTVTATRVAGGYANAAVATTTDAAAVGATLEALGVAATTNAQISAFLGKLDSLGTAAAVTTALKQTTPQVNSTSVQAVSNTSQSNNVVTQRLADLRAGIDNSNQGMAAGGKVADKGVWIQGFGSSVTQDLRTGVDGYDATTGGGAIGADMSVADNTRAGLSFSYAKTNVDGNGTSTQSNDIDSYQVNAYGSYNMGNWYTDGLLGFAYQNYNSERTIVSTSNLIASGSYSGQTYTARAGGGYRFQVGNGFDISPNASLTYFYNHADSYTESGAGGLDLMVNSSNSQALLGRIGLDAGYDFHTATALIRPVVRAGYSYDFVGDQVENTSTFTGGGAAFKTKDASPERNAFNLGASLNVVRTDNISFSADYDYLGKSDYSSHSGVLRARFNF